MKNHVAVLALTMASIPVFAGSQIGKVIELDTRADGLIYFVLRVHQPTGQLVRMAKHIGQLKMKTLLAVKYK